MATDVWIRKYCLKNGDDLYELNPDEMHWRLAREIARIEAKYPNALSVEYIYSTLKNFKRIIPQGSPMSGIGNDFQVVSLSNCFVIGNETDSDSYGGIMKLDQETVQLEKRRGGVGLDLSFVRPKGSPVKNSAITSTGVVPFMERFSNSTKEVAQDGRRGALMESISIKHPDSEDFIDAKLTKGKVTGANVSVRIDDDFMKSVMNKTDYVQKFPIKSSFNYNIQDLKYNENIQIKDDNNDVLGFIRKVDAEKIWKKIIHNAWKSAEPGILFWDKVLSESIPDCYADLGFETKSTNPCVSYDTPILTDKGYKEIGGLVGSKVNVWNGKEFSEVEPMITGEDQPMLKIAFSDGSELKCTDYHGFYTWEGYSRDGNVVKKEAKDLNVGDKLEKYDFPVLDYQIGESFKLDSNNFDMDFARSNNFINEKSWYTLGFYAGDGTLHRKKEHMIHLYGEKRELLEYFNYTNNPSNNEEVDRTTIRADFSQILLSINNEEYKKYVPKFDDSTLQKTLYWLAGIIDSDGSRNSSEGSISISSIDRDFLLKIKLNVLNTLGVNGSVIDEKEGGLKEIKGIEYNTNKSYRLIINASNVKKLYNLGLRTHRVKIDDINPNRDASRFITVKSIERIENADKVYCFTDPKRGRGCFNGVVTANCGEITLCPYDSCRLLVVNLYGYVVNPFTKDAYFNWDLFTSDVRTAQRYMDNIIDLEIEKIDKIIEKIDSDPEDEFIKMYERNLWEKIKEKAILGRRTGLGITAEGDMLASLGFIYGTDKATDFSESVHEKLKIEAYRSSVELAKERGAFPIYDSEREIGNPFIQRIKDVDPQLYEDMVKYGRRNIALLTIAPVGTTSIMSQTTSGIEPVFLPVYKRRRKINTQEKNVKVDFVDDEGQGWVEYTVFHHKFKTWLEVNGYNVDEVEKYTQEELDMVVQKSPYYKATSNDVDWVKKVEMQGRIQQHIDHSISVTVNLPSDVTEETVSKVYETGWRSGCKGITVYRDGSRSGVLISNDKKEEKQTVIVNDAPKRPKRLKGEIHRFNNNYEKWIAVIGIYEGKPYELFTGKLENGLKNLPVSVKDCEIVQKIISNENGGKFKRYDMEYVDGSGEKHVYEGLNFKFNPEFWNYAKLISGILRHGMPTVSAYKLIESLSFREENINTWKNGVVRAIKKYIKDGEKTKGQCLNCGADDFAFQEGCLICQNCGWSKCS
jgi:ribonucleotide reductase alpha subunit